MPAQFWESVVNSPGIGAASAYTNSTTLTDVSPAPQYVIPANTLYVGQRWRLTAYGIFSSVSTPTLLMGFYYGGVASTLLASNGTPTLGNGTNWPFRIYLDMQVRSLGSSGTVWCNGLFYVGTSLTALTITAIPSTQTQPITINTTTANALTVGAQWGAQTASNTLTVEDLVIEQQN